MDNFLEKISKVEEKMLILSLAFNTLLVFFQIIMRSIFNASISWSEELSRYIFIWQIWIGTSIAYSYGEHIQVELIYNLIKAKKGQEILKLIVDIMWIVFNIFLVVIGFKMCKSMMLRNALSSGMRVHLAYVYAVLPLSSSVLSIKILNTIIKRVKKLFTNEKSSMEVK